MSSVYDAVEAMKELAILDWHALQVGLQQGWASRRDVIDFAVDWLVSHQDENDHRVALMAGGESCDDEELGQLLSSYVSSNDLSFSEDDTKDKWRLAHLWALNASEQNSELQLDRLEELYAEFGYPEDMMACSRYFVPPDQSNAVIGECLSSPLDAMRQVIAELRSRFSAQ